MNIHSISVPEWFVLAFGFAGQAMFSARFLIQWIASERSRKSVVPVLFWYFSLGGGLTLFIYALYREDPVFMLGQGFGLIVYIRNLWLIRHEKHAAARPAAARPQRVNARRRTDATRCGSPPCWPRCWCVSLFRPLLPIDETRYASVAWEMWVRGDFLVPFRNGEPYHHKPPLLFWLMHAGWAVFGVNEWWPRLISPLFAAGTLVLTYRLGRRLWPQWPEVARMAPFILLASALFAYFASALMFDVMIAFFVALACSAWCAPGRPAPERGGFVLLALGLGGALFAKGPVALLHLLPPALLAPWWMREQTHRRGAAGTWACCWPLLGGAVLILAWAVPAGISGGEEYRNAIFWGQTAGRMTRSFAHRAPWWFYLAWLPLMLAPWLLWPRWWRDLHRGLWAESGFRLAVLCTMFGLLAFSLISGKRWHYLLPQFVPFALIAARALHDSRPGRGSLALQGGVMAALGLGVVLGAPRLAAGLGSPDAPYALYWGRRGHGRRRGRSCARLRPGSSPARRAHHRHRHRRHRRGAGDAVPT